MELYSAPLQGITTYLFRDLHARLFGGVDRYFTPFFSPVSERIVTKRDQRELTPAHNDLRAVVPQVMTRRAEDFIWAAELLFRMGYGEVNLNLGCPSGTVTAKGKGAGFLLRPEELDGFFRQVFSALPDRRITVKTRLGFRDPAEFRDLLAIYNRYPIAQLTVHPRVREDFYKVPVRREAFAQALPHIQAPVCYNGDLFTPADCRAFSSEFPTVEAVMLGRGLIADPALGRKLRGGPAATREEVAAFVHALYAGYQAAYGAGPAVQRMKQLWIYLICLFDGGERIARKLCRVRNPADYETLEAEIFRTLPLRRDAAGVP